MRRGQTFETAMKGCKHLWRATPRRIESESESILPCKGFIMDTLSFVNSARHDDRFRSLVGTWYGGEYDVEGNTVQREQGGAQQVYGSLHETDLGFEVEEGVSR